MDAQWYGSIAGIVAGTLIIVEVLKRAIGNVAVLKGVPTWIYAVVVAVALTYASRAAGYLADQGSTLDVLMSALMLAASASGFWTWLRQPNDPIKDSEPARNADIFRGIPIVLLAVALAGAVSCGANLAPVLTASESMQHAGLKAAQDRVEAVCGLPATTDTCRVVYTRLADTWDAQIAYAESLLAEKPILRGGLIEAVGRLVTSLATFPADVRDAIEADLRRVVNDVLQGG